MRLFGRGKPKTHKTLAGASRCPHPVTHQVSLFGDPAHPTRLTGVRCTNCGQELPAP